MGCPATPNIGREAGPQPPRPPNAAHCGAAERRGHENHDAIARNTWFFRTLLSADHLAGARLVLVSIELQGGRTDPARVHVRQLMGEPSAVSPAVLRVDPLWSALKSPGRSVPR